MIFKSCAFRCVYKSLLCVMFMSFQSIWLKTWSDYRAHFATTSKIMLIYHVIPFMVVLGIMLSLILRSGFVDTWNAIAVLDGVNVSALGSGEQVVAMNTATAFLGSFALIFLTSIV